MTPSALMHSTSAQTADVACPEVVKATARAGPEHAAAALEAACRAADDWARTAPAIRAAVLSRAAERLRRESERVASLLALECGKPLLQGREEVACAAEPPATAAAPPAGTVTIVFTDIEGSTEIAERLGDRRWVEALAEHDRTVRRHAAAHGGYEVKAQGDGLMLAFPSARWAVDFAVAVQRSMASGDASRELLRVRIGLHTGEAIRRGNDFFGLAVMVAARIAGQCRGGEIVVSDLVKRLVDSAGDLAFDEGRDVALKGLREPHRVHNVRWEDPPPATASPTRRSSARSEPSRPFATTMASGTKRTPRSTASQRTSQRDLTRGVRFAADLDYGMVGINRARRGCEAAPFGAKASGNGRGASEGSSRPRHSFTAVGGLT